MTAVDPIPSYTKRYFIHNSTATSKKITIAVLKKKTLSDDQILKITKT